MSADAYVYRLACGHDVPAPEPEPDAGDAKVMPPLVYCNKCGMGRRPLGYDRKAEQ